MSPKKVDKEERKQEIALIALDLFASQGIEKSSISQIAKAAGIGKGTVYEYFASKEEIVATAFMAWIESMMGPDLEDMLARIESPEERLRKSVLLMMESGMEDERSLKIMLSLFQMMLQSKDSLSKNQDFLKIFHFMWEFFRDILLDGVSRGVFRIEAERNAQKIVVNLLAYLDGISFHYLVNKDEIQFMQQIEFYLDRLLEYLRIAR